MKHEESVAAASMSNSNEINETDEINKLCDLYTKTSSAVTANLTISPPQPETILTKPYINNNNNNNNNNNKAHVGNSDEAIVPNNNINNEQKLSQEYCIEYIINQNSEKQKLLLNNNDNSDLENNLKKSPVKEEEEEKEEESKQNLEENINSNEQILSSKGGLEMVNDKLSETSSDSGNGTNDLIMVHSPHEYLDDNLRNNRSKISPESNHSLSSNGCDNSANTSNDFINKNESINEDDIDNKPSLPQSTSTMSISSTATQSDIIVYEFHFPRKYCGKLIGRNGVHVDYIRNKTHVQIAVRNDPALEDLQIVCLTGSIGDVDQALEIISARFPYRHYPQISFKPIAKIVCRRNRIENNKVLVSSNMYIQLPAKGVQFDAHVSAIVTPTHLFIQLPSHPTYERLQYLDGRMLDLYTTSDKNIPVLTAPVDSGTICAAPTSYGWHRAMVTEYQKTLPLYVDNTEMATIKFLDYGGYLNIPVNQLKQLRTDFMTLPFQAIEVFLDGITNVEGQEEEGKNLLSKLIKTSQLKAVITGYTEEGAPLIKLFSVNSTQKSFLINSELVTNGYARKTVV